MKYAPSWPNAIRPPPWRLNVIPAGWPSTVTFVAHRDRRASDVPVAEEFDMGDVVAVSVVNGHPVPGDVGGHVVCPDHEVEGERDTVQHSIADARVVKHMRVRQVRR